MGVAQVQEHRSNVLAAQRIPNRSRDHFVGDDAAQQPGHRQEKRSDTHRADAPAVPSPASNPVDQLRSRRTSSTLQARGTCSESIAVPSRALTGSVTIGTPSAVDIGPPWTEWTEHL